MSLITESTLPSGTDVQRPSQSAEHLRGVLAIAGATLGMASGFGLLILSSVFIGPLIAEFGWSRSETSLGYVCAAMGMAAGGLVWGRVSDRIDLRWMLAMGGICQVIPLVCFAVTQGLWQFLAAHLLLGFFGFGALYAPYVAVASDWFSARRGLVMGIVTAGGAIGQGTLPYLAEVLSGSLGWRQALMAIAAGMAGVQSLVYLTVRYREPHRRLGAVKAEAGSLLKPRLLVLGAAAFFCCACMGMPLFHLAGFVTMLCGSSNLGATSLLVAMTSGAVGRIAVGFLADRIGCYASYRIVAFGQAASVAVFPVLTGVQSLMILSAIFGFAFSSNMTCMLLCIRQEAPPTRLGAAIGGILFVAWAGMAAGGYLGGAVFDATGSFAPGFLAAAAAGLTALVLLSFLDIAPGILRREPAGEAQY
jgi:predicted MFS family arabinose efflux permease